MRTIFKRYLPFVLLLLGTIVPANAQPYDLVPEKWYPLVVGSRWHYTDEGSEGVGMIRSYWVDQAIRDTIVDGRRWTLIETTHCIYGPGCPAVGGGGWFTFSEDHYLLFRSPFTSAPDTVLAAWPVSIFSVTASDTLQVPSSDYPLVVRVGHNEAGSEADSTHLMLDAYANVFYSGRFIYTIGRADGLIGAIVGGVEYGDTRALRQIRLPVDTPRTIGAPAVVAYPNPFSSHLTIELTAGLAGEYALSLHDALGRQVYATSKWFEPGQAHRFEEFVPDGSHASGVYFVRVTYADEVVKTRRVVLIR